MKLRSLLFAPGDQPRKIARAFASPADAAILDLEDAVAPDGKDAARATVAAALADSGPERRPGVVVRVNAQDTPWYLADLASVVPLAPAAIMLPKCAGPHALLALHHHLEALETAAGLPAGGIAVLPLVTETAAAVLRLDYAGAPRLLALCFGAEDLSADLGITPRRPDGTFPAPVAAARAAMLLAAAAAGVPALDTPWPDPRDPAGMAAEAEAAAADGFAGKLLIHPGQIEPAHAAFTPTEAQLRWARAVTEAFAAAPGAGVLALDGRMIDRPHLRLAQRLLAAGT